MQQKPIPTSDQFTQSSDSEIITSCLQGEANAWEALIHRYQRLIYSIPLKMRLSQDDAADIFQAVCLKLYENLSKLREQERLSSWLITTTNRECWRLSARQRREAPADDLGNEEESDIISQLPANTPLPDEERIALEQQQAVRQGIAALSERCRELLTRLFYQKEELSYQEIARQMEMPVASIGPTRARCLDKLKKLLEGKI